GIMGCGRCGRPFDRGSGPDWHVRIPICRNLSRERLTEDVEGEPNTVTRERCMICEQEFTQGRVPSKLPLGLPVLKGRMCLECEQSRPLNYGAGNSASVLPISR